MSLPKLLVVDDDAGSLDALERTLRADFEILKARNAEEALKHLETNPQTAIVLSDERMPGQSGTELLTDIKIRFPQVIRVIISGQLSLEKMLLAVNKAEVHQVIVKPWQNHELRLHLQEALLHHKDLEQMLKLQQLAITDPVTGLTNHRFFQERIREETDRSNRHGRVYSLIMIDVDHFKKFNDRFGHPEGDRALAHIARLLKKATRTADSVSRYGGEEFAMLLPETAKQAAFEVADRIRRDLENAPIGGSKDSPHMITLSLGVASFPSDGKSADQVIRAADQALYQAKEKGRNRVEVHP
jgi:diguanylate cyclase (GGDEF)-like protein